MKKTLLILIILLFLQGCCCPLSNNISSSPPENTQKDLVVIKYQLQKEGDNQYITGQVKNNMNKVAKSVFLKFNLYNNSGVQIGDTIDNVGNIDPGGIWEFKTDVNKEGTTSVKPAELTHYN